MSTRGREMHDLVAELYPLCRSITGDGVRETLRRVAKHVPLETREVASGTQVFDWTVPPEWNVRAAHITGPDGRRVVDFETSNLHLMSYSVPTRARVSRAELDAHLHSLPDHPDWVPYRTSYYSRDWGFCLSERQRASLGEGEYEVVVDSDLRDGHLTYGELLISMVPPGQSHRYWQTLLFGTKTLARPLPSMSATIGVSYAVQLAFFSWTSVAPVLPS